MKPGSLLSFAFMLLVALAHLLRLAFAIPITVAGRAIPMWPSVLAVPVFAGIALLLWRENRSRARQP